MYIGARAGRGAEFGRGRDADYPACDHLAFEPESGAARGDWRGGRSGAGGVRDRSAGGFVRGFCTGVGAGVIFHKIVLDALMGLVVVAPAGGKKCPFLPFAQLFLNVCQGVPIN